MVGETEVKERPKSNPDYLMQLMNDRKVMSSLPNFSGIFTHLERLLDEGNEPLHCQTLDTRMRALLSFFFASLKKVFDSLFKCCSGCLSYFSIFSTVGFNVLQGHVQWRWTPTLINDDVITVCHVIVSLFPPEITHSYTVLIS